MEFNTKKIKSTGKRSLFGDFDGDGVMNAFDCQPKNKKKQDTDNFGFEIDPYGEQEEDQKIRDIFQAEYNEEARRSKKK